MRTVIAFGLHEVPNVDLEPDLEVNVAEQYVVCDAKNMICDLLRQV